MIVEQNKLSHVHDHKHIQKHDHDHPNKKVVINRFARIIGHLEGVKRMVEDDTDCSDILIQISAVRSALNNTGKIILEDHINHCLIHAHENNDTEAITKLSEAIGKFLK